MLLVLLSLFCNFNYFSKPCVRTRQRVRARDMSRGEPLQAAPRSGYVLRASFGLPCTFARCLMYFFLYNTKKQH